MIAIAIGGVAFSIYRSYSKPDEKAAIAIALLNARMTTVEKVVTNDIPHDLASFKTTVDDVHSDVSSLKELVVKLQTIIDERIPRKT